MYDDLTEFTSPYVNNFMKLATAKPGMILNCGTSQGKTHPKNKKFIGKNHKRQPKFYRIRIPKIW